MDEKKKEKENKERDLEAETERYIVPRKQAPPPRGTRPTMGVAGRYAQKVAARQMLGGAGGASDGANSGTNGGANGGTGGNAAGNRNPSGTSMEQAMRITAITQRAIADGKRRQIDVRELEEIAEMSEN